MIWMFRIAMKAPIMLARTAIQEVRLAPVGRRRSGWHGTRRGEVHLGVAVDMACLLREFGLGSAVAVRG